MKEETQASSTTDTEAKGPASAEATDETQQGQSTTSETGEGAQRKQKEKSSRLRAVGLVSLATMLSRILGLLRDMVFAALFRRDATDAYAIAFLFPNLLRRLLAEGILSTAFIPVFTGYMQKDEKEQRRAYGAVLGVFIVILVVVTILGVIFAPWLVKLFAPGFSGAKLSLTIFLTRLMFPFLLLVGLSSFWFGVLHTHKHFAAPAFGPILLNVGIIACALTLRGLFPASHAVAAMSIGVLVGGLLQLLLQVFALMRRGIRVALAWTPTHPAIKEILALMGPTLLGLGVYQLNMLVSSAIASLLTKGSVTYIYYSNRLMELPLGVIAVAFATVNLPTLSAKAESEEWEDFRETLLFGMRGVLFVCIPAAFGLFVLREPIIGVLFQRGLFTYQDTLYCAQVFAPAAFGLILVGALRNLTPGFYAMKDTKTPVKIAFWSFLINAILSFLFAFSSASTNVPFGLSRLGGIGLGATGLTLANTCSAAFSVLASLLLLHRKIGPFSLSAVLKSSAKVTLASLLMAAALWPLTKMGPWAQPSLLPRLIWLSGLCAVGGCAFVLFAFLLRTPELTQTLAKIKRKL